MRGFVAVTDPGWYERLAALGQDRGPMDANFWRPSARRVALPTGTPFLFKLRAPANAIAGFGYFASFSVLPDWIGCSLIAEARFFPRNQWVTAPSDWKPRTQTGASIDLTVGEGLRVWSDCLTRFPQAAASVMAPQRPRYGALAMYRPRLGQGSRASPRCVPAGMRGDP
jgi:putative restriction endonuclease